jgi:Asp/Glu/hydantoin racemase
MEKQITVVVRVSSEEHAQVIREEIVAVIKNRTPIYIVTAPHKPAMSIEQFVIPPLTEPEESNARNETRDR